MIEQIQAESTQTKRIPVEEMQANPNIFIERVRDKTYELLKKYGWQFRVDNFQWKRGVGLRGEIGLYKEGASKEEKQAMEAKLNEIFERYRMYPIVIRFNYYPDGNVKELIGFKLKGE